MDFYYSANRRTFPQYKFGLNGKDKVFIEFVPAVKKMTVSVNEKTLLEHSYDENLVSNSWYTVEIAKKNGSWKIVVSKEGVNIIDLHSMEGLKDFEGFSVWGMPIGKNSLYFKNLSFEYLK